jgi:diketogulonate reductase-like aldo/keto reductase
MSIPTLSAHGATMPVIGLGTSGMGDVRAETIATALKLGYRHIDTAWKYGTERQVGEGMRASGVPRAEIFLCTKVSHE